MSLPIEIESRLNEIRAEVEREGVELLEVMFRRGGSRGVLTFVVDKPGGVTLDECANINRKLGLFLDNFFESSYFLEVNSPGLDRPLKNFQDFQRVRGLKIRVAWRTEKGAGLVTAGTLIDLNEESIELEIKAGEKLMIPLNAITKASREVKI